MLYPPAVKRLIPPGKNDPKITPIGAILHVAASTEPSLYPYFNGPSDGIESHFYVQEDGGVEQYRDTQVEADANYKGNSFMKDGKLCGYVSIETWGLEPGEWNPAQIRSIKNLLVWLHGVHTFPLEVCATPTSPGVGYHVMFGAPGPWTPRAKSCPGPKRVAQFDNILVPWMTAPSVEEDDMPYTKDEIRQMVQDELEEYNKRFWVAPTGTGTQLRAQVAAILQNQDPAKLAADIVAKLPKGNIDQATVEAGVRAVLLDAGTVG